MKRTNKWRRGVHCLAWAGLAAFVFLAQIRVQGNQISGVGSNCEAIKWEQEAKANASRDARMEAARVKYQVAQQNCQNIYDNDNWTCRCDYDAAMFEANKKRQSASSKCFLFPKPLEWWGCVVGAQIDYEATQSVADYKKWDCYDRAIRRMDQCLALAWGGWFADKTWADGERKARQTSIDLDYQSCVAKRRG